MVCFSFASAAPAGTTLPQAVLGAGSLNSGTLCRAGGDGCVFVHLPAEVSQGEAKQYLISPSGLCKLETKYHLFLSLKTCMYVCLA